MCLGRINCYLKIGLINKLVHLYVLDNAHQDIIIGLDLIKVFKLKLEDDFRVFQQIKFNDELISVEIKSNYSKYSNLNESKDSPKVNQKIKQCKNT